MSKAAFHFDTIIYCHDYIIIYCHAASRSWKTQTGHACRIWYVNFAKIIRKMTWWMPPPLKPTRSYFCDQAYFFLIPNMRAVPGSRYKTIVDRVGQSLCEKRPHFQESAISFCEPHEAALCYIRIHPRARSSNTFLRNSFSAEWRSRSISRYPIIQGDKTKSCLSQKLAAAGTTTTTRPSTLTTSTIRTKYWWPCHHTIGVTSMVPPSYDQSIIKQERGKLSPTMLLLLLILVFVLVLVLLSKMPALILVAYERRMRSTKRMARRWRRRHLHHYQ